MLGKWELVYERTPWKFFVNLTFISCALILVIQRFWLILHVLIFDNWLKNLQNFQNSQKLVQTKISMLKLLELKWLIV